MKRTMTVLATLAAFTGGFGTSFAGVIDFNTIGHGVVATTQIPGLTISAENFTEGHPDIALGFDTTETGTRDDDLEGPNWAGGNVATTTELGTVIIIAENDVDANNDSIVDDPDDEGNRPAGWIKFEFDNPINSIGFDLVDIEGTGAAQEPGDFATFMMGLNVIASIPFAELMPGGLYDQGAVFGNNTLNRIAPISGPGPFDTVVITLGGSGAVDNLVFDRQVPAPGALGLLALGLGLVGVVRRRQR